MMTKRVRTTAAAVFIAGVYVGTTSSSASAAASLDGKDVSQMLCSRCHDTVGTKVGGRKLGDGSAPPFVLIAQDPKMTPSAMRSFLRLPHGSMAVVNLTESEIDGLVAHILSFSTAAKPAAAK